MYKDITVLKNFTSQSENFGTRTDVSRRKVVIGQAPLNLLEVDPNLNLCGKFPKSLQPSQVAKYCFCLCLEGDDNGITEIVLVFEQSLYDVYEVFG